MAETLGIFNITPASRSPAAATWKILYTAAQPLTYSVHVNNASGGDSGIRMAVIPASAGYVDGTAPPAYSLVYGSLTASKFIESLSEIDTPAFIMGIGDSVVVYCDNVGVTFYNAGIQFS